MVKGSCRVPGWRYLWNHTLLLSKVEVDQSCPWHHLGCSLPISAWVILAGFAFLCPCKTFGASCQECFITGTKQHVVTVSKAVIWVLSNSAWARWSITFHAAHHQHQNQAGGNTKSHSRPTGQLLSIQLSADPGSHWGRPPPAGHPVPSPAAPPCHHDHAEFAFCPRSHQSLSHSASVSISPHSPFYSRHLVIFLIKYRLWHWE